MHQSSPRAGDRDHKPSPILRLSETRHVVSADNLFRIRMRHRSMRTILTLTFFLSVTTWSIAHAGCTTQYIGGTPIPNCDSDVDSTSWNIGDTTFRKFGGQTGTSWNIDETTFQKFGGQAGTDKSIGGTTYPNFGGTTEICRIIGGPEYCNRSSPGSADS